MFIFKKKNQFTNQNNNYNLKKKKKNNISFTIF